MSERQDGTLFPAEALERLKAAGFECATVGGPPERIRVLKRGCALLFERQDDDRLRVAQAPGYFLRGEIGRLWDAGYQKFWLLGPVTPEPFQEPRRPASSDELRALHEFTEDLKQALDLPSYFNEALGTTSDVTAYDRVRGR